MLNNGTSVWMDGLVKRYNRIFFYFESVFKSSTGYRCKCQGIKVKWSFWLKYFLWELYDVVLFLRDKRNYFYFILDYMCCPLFGKKIKKMIFFNSNFIYSIYWQLIARENYDWLSVILFFFFLGCVPKGFFYERVRMLNSWTVCVQNMQILQKRGWW